MSEVTFQLVHGDTKDPTDATLNDHVSFDDLIDAESVWYPARLALIKDLRKREVPSKHWPEHWHWNWIGKLLRSDAANIDNPFSVSRIMGISCDGDWQGLVLCKQLGHTARLGSPNRDLIYVDYLEVAPWNLKVPLTSQTGRYRGIGKHLICQAVRLSHAAELGGRVGLHALPQAEGFYERLGFTRIEQDSDPQKLTYFELTETQAKGLI